MSCCPARPCKPIKATEPCLGRCTLPKHRCLIYEDVKPGPVPRNLGWIYTARTSPSHQLRCGWRPGHISCGVLKQKAKLSCSRCGNCCYVCPSTPCIKSQSCLVNPECVSAWPSSTSVEPSGGPLPLLKIVRHGGQYTICTKPSNISNAPSGPFPLKYVLNPSNDTGPDGQEVKYSVEAKYNDYQFDYSCSQSSFILDFSPPGPKCKPSCLDSCCGVNKP